METNGNVNLLPAVQELVNAAQERKMIMGDASPLFTESVSTTTNKMVGTNFVYFTTNSVLTNFVWSGNLKAALSLVDDLIYSGSGTFAQRDIAASPSSFFNLNSSTNWCFDTNSHCWVENGYGHPDNIPHYYIGSHDSRFINQDVAFPTSLVQEANCGAVFFYTNSLTTVTNVMNGYEVGQPCTKTVTQGVQRLSTTIDDELQAIPQRAFPTQGVPLVRFVYGPAPWQNSSVARYPRWVSLSGCTESNANGRYLFDTIVHDETTNSLTYPSYVSTNGGSHKIYLGDVLQVFEEDFGFEPFVQWIVSQHPNLLTNVEYAGGGGDFAGYSQSQELSVPTGGSAPLGSNVFLSIPLYEGSNWITEVTWQAQKLSPLLNDELQIPFTNYAPPVFRAKTVDTNDHSIIPFEASVFSREFISPHATNDHQFVGPQRFFTNDVWNFSSTGHGPTLTNNIFEIVLSTNMNFQGDTIILTNTAGAVVSDLDKTNAMKHWGDEVTLFYTKPTAMYGRFHTPYPLYPETVNARWECLRRYTHTVYAQDVGFIIQEANATNISATADATPGPDAPYPDPWPAFVGSCNGASIAFTNTPALGHLRSFFQYFAIADGYYEVHGDEFDAEVCINGIISGLFSLQRGKPIASIPSITNTMTNADFGVEQMSVFTLTEDGTEKKNCPSENNVGSCSYDYWDAGTDGKFQLSETASSPDEYITNSVSFGVTNQLKFVKGSQWTTANASHPHLVDNCATNFDESPSFQGVDTTTPCGGSNPEGYAIGREQRGGGGRFSGNTYQRSILKWKLQHED